MNNTNGLLNYQHLYDVFGHNDPAECHGLLCGLLCTDETLARDTWLQHIDLEYQSNDLAVLQNLFKTTHEQLQDDNFIFQLLLPDDDDELRLRVDSLGNWCQGFLSGLGLGGMHSTEQLSLEVKDFLQDVSQIARLGLSAENGDEDDEIAYTEIVEYLRAGVLLVSQELQRDKRPTTLARAKLH